MMTFWMMWRLPHRMCFIIFCTLLAYLNALSNESTLNEEWYFGNGVLLKEHYTTIFNLLEKSSPGKKLIRLENEKLPIQVFGCVPGYDMIIAAFAIHERSKIPETRLICSDDINAAAIIDIKNALNRIWQFNKKMIVHNMNTEMGIGMYLIDDCNEENFAWHLLKFVEHWSTDEKETTCSLRPESVYGYTTKFSSFPIRSLDSTFHAMRENPIDEDAKVARITKEEVQNFSFETFKDSYIVCSILKHFGWTKINLIHDTEFDEHRFVKIAAYFNICVASLSLENIDENATDLYRHNFFWRNGVDPEEVYVIFCNRPPMFDKLIRAIDQVTQYIATSNSWETKNIFITGDDSLPQDRKLNETSNFLVFHKEVKNVKNDSTDDGKLKLMQECFMTNRTLNSTHEDCWLSESECNFPKNELWFLQNRILNNTANNTESTSKSEFPDPHVLSDTKCQRLFLSKLDEILFRYIFHGCDDGEICLDALQKLLIQMSADNSWLQSLYTINLKIEPANISIGNGAWDASSRRIIFQTLPNATDYLSVESKCSATSLCSSGQREKVLRPDKPCCWKCENCDPNQILIWNECQTCKSNEWPNKNRTECVPKEKRRLRWDDLEIVICVTYSTLIIVLIVTTLLIFIKKRNTPVVKASTRELSFMILIAMIAVESTIFIFMSRPEKPLCGAIHIVTLLSFSTIYAGLLVRTVRIARLLALSKNEFPQQNMKCMSLKSQVIITINLIIVQLVIALLMLYYTTPLPNKNRDYIDPQGSVAPMLTPICQYSLRIFTMNFSFVFGLVALCTGCAVWVRKVPDNFNEAKYIGFCTYATCLTWTAFGFTLFAQHNYEILALCACFSTNNLLALVFLFFPKLYIIIFKPEKNHRRYFNTSSKSIRVHKRESTRTNLLMKNLDKRKN